VKLTRALADLAEHLFGCGRSFALVGGLATSVRGEARFTRDIDLVVVVEDDSDAEQLLLVVRGHGYGILATIEQDAVGRLATVRLGHPSGVVCDLIFATCGIEAEVVASAEPVPLSKGVLIPTASVEALLAMKVLSASERRPRDLEDIRSMILANPDYDRGAVVELLGRIEARGSRAAKRSYRSGKI
jgi:hypothetical protein